VKWKGFPDSYNQWIDTKNMSADELIQEYLQSKFKKKK